MSETKAFKLINTFPSLLLENTSFLLKIQPQLIFNAVCLHINVPNKEEELSCHLYLKILPSPHFEAEIGRKRGEKALASSFPRGRADGGKSIARWEIQMGAYIGGLQKAPSL